MACLQTSQCLVTTINQSYINQIRFDFILINIDFYSFFSWVSIVKIYQTLKPVFDHIFKNTRRIFSSLPSVRKYGQTRSLVSDILLECTCQTFVDSVFSIILNLYLPGNQQIREALISDFDSIGTVRRLSNQHHLISSSMHKPMSQVPLYFMPYIHNRVFLSRSNAADSWPWKLFPLKKKY